MKEYFVTFRSITFAQRGQQVMQDAGISAQLQRTPRWMEEKGRGCRSGASEGVRRALQPVLFAPG